MSKTILRAELKRLESFERLIEKGCPVCKASYKVKNKKYNAKNCFLYRDTSACSPAVQRRCRRFEKIEEKLTNLISDSIFEIEMELEK